MSAVQTVGPSQVWSLDEMLLREDGTAQIVEFESPARTFAARWYVELDNTVVVAGDNIGCTRRGTRDGQTLGMTCATSTRAWALVFVRQ